VTTSLRRATAFALVAALSLTAPALGWAAPVPFAVVAAGAGFITSGPLFELFARPRDRREGRLNGLLSFALAATALAMLPAAFGMPVGLFVATVLLVAVGTLASTASSVYSTEEFASTTAFVTAAFLAAILGQLAVSLLAPTTLDSPGVVFLGAIGALLAGLLRSVFHVPEEPLELFSVGLTLWFFADLPPVVSWEAIAVALVATVGFGYVSYALDTASIPGMLTGILLGLLTIVLGGYTWFVLLLAFFAVGALATKFRYERKLERGVAEDRGGARGSGNVLGNAAPALIAVVLHEASQGGGLALPSELFFFAFAGSIATALSDTLSSEVGGLYDSPRLITTLERVEAGTDGGVTWQGELAGVAGATLVAGLTIGLSALTLAGAAVIVGAGVVGMTVDSLLGAVLEGDAVGNQAVNFLATGSGALAGGLFAAAAGFL